ncbi:hypothetical protein LI328DRAFT_98424 [Trichoderma asperelloides]|nr:hypothetical protein LI328DRAFT_98424 [Trichoderma asperelloides]
MALRGENICFWLFFSRNLASFLFLSFSFLLRLCIFCAPPSFSFIWAAHMSPLPANLTSSLPPLHMLRSISHLKGRRVRKGRLRVVDLTDDFFFLFFFFSFSFIYNFITQCSL